MGHPDSAILGLRTQILENWRYAHPENTNVVIVTTYEYRTFHRGGRPALWEALIAEDRGYADRIFLRAQSEFTVEDALRKLLRAADELVKKVAMDTPVVSLEVKPLKQDDTNAESLGDESGQHTKDSNQSSEEDEVKRFHHALGHVIDLASKN